MLSLDDEGEDVFFDSVDYIRNCDFVSSEECGSEELLCGKLDYGIWRKEPESVQERREKFLCGMGFSEFVHSQLDCSQEIGEDAYCVSSSNILGSERIREGSGAVSSSWASFGNRREEGSVCSRRDQDGGTKFVASEVGRNLSNRLTTEFETSIGFMPSVGRHMRREATAHGEEHDRDIDIRKKKIRSWWKCFMNKRKWGVGICKSDVSIKNREAPKTQRMKVQQNRKRCREFTAVYMGQEYQAHKGFIWTMKFSPDGRYLASGGEDGVVRIWPVTSGEASCKYFTAEGTSNLDDKVEVSKFILGRKNSNPASVVIPKKVFKIEESPLQEFHGHTSDILDLSWSKSNCLLSSSKDKTVRLWKVGCDQCLNVFRHHNYVTCIQFNPVDDGYFASGSIDGKVRIWGVSESRVVDWADVRDVVTAICYQPDGQGFVVGSVTGNCRFYDASGIHLQLDAQICIQGRRKSSGNRVTGLQFTPEDSQRVMITTADSKVRIFDGVEVIHTYRGLRKSGSQMSASFTSNGRHIVSVGEDSRVYVWNYDGFCVPSPKQPKSIRSCEHFFYEGVSVAIPWPGIEPEQIGLGSGSIQSSSQTPECLQAASWLRDSERFSLGGWFSMDGPLRGSATWPEEKLPLGALPIGEYHGHHHLDQQHNHHYHYNLTDLLATWGLVIVTAGWDGVIRTFHNYGLPVRP